MPSAIAPSQVHGVRNVAAVLAAMEAVAGDRVDEVRSLRGALAAYFTTYNLPAHAVLSSELENILRGIIELQPDLLPITVTFCRSLGLRPPAAYYEVY